MGYSIAYNSGTTTPFGTFKQGTITMGLKPDEYTVSSGFTWYANAETPNDNYLIISDTYSQGWSTQAESKPTIWRSETGTTESFVSLVNQLPDVNGVTGFTDSGTAMKYLMDSGKYFVNKDDYLGIVTDGLILNLDAGWYPSYSGTGTTWKNLKGTNTATLVNGPTFSGGSIVFDGVDDYAEINHNTLLNPTLNMSISVWVNLPSISTDRVSASLCGKGTSTDGQGGYDFRIDYFGGFYSINLVKYFVVDQRVAIPVPLSANTWYNFTAVQTSNRVTYYIDGSSIGFFSNSSNYQTNTINFRIGLNRPGRTLYYLNGKLPHLLFYNKALSTEEILQNYNATKGRFGL